MIFVTEREEMQHRLLLQSLNMNYAESYRSSWGMFLKFLSINRKRKQQQKITAQCILVRDKWGWLTDWIFQSEVDSTMCTCNFQGKGVTHDLALAVYGDTCLMKLGMIMTLAPFWNAIYTRGRTKKQKSYKVMQSNTELPRLNSWVCCILLDWVVS